MKVARTVLRRGRGSDAPPLSDIYSKDAIKDAISNILAGEEEKNEATILDSTRANCYGIISYFQGDGDKAQELNFKNAVTPLIKGALSKSHHISVEQPTSVEADKVKEDIGSQDQGKQGGWIAKLGFHERSQDKASNITTGLK